MKFAHVDPWHDYVLGEDLPTDHVPDRLEGFSVSDWPCVTELVLISLVLE